MGLGCLHSTFDVNREIGPCTPSARGELRQAKPRRVADGRPKTAKSRPRKPRREASRLAAVRRGIAVNRVRKGILERDRSAINGATLAPEKPQQPIGDPAARITPSISASHAAIEAVDLRVTGFTAQLSIVARKRTGSLSYI